MTKMTYAEQLRHPNWQRKRLETLQSVNWQCERCDAADTTLNVHHKQYFRGRMAWEYERDELSVLCEPCHADEHEVDDLLKRLLAVPALGGTQLRQAAGLLAGYLLASYELPEDLEKECRRLGLARQMEVGVMAEMCDVAPLTALVPALAMLVNAESAGPVVEGLLDELARRGS